MKKDLSITLSFHRHLLLVYGLMTSLLTSVYAQTDTLIVRGKVENLTFRLYRQAPEISVARVNILQPTREIVKVAQLQSDGSFELKMPLIFPQEECYFTYANVVLPFLGAEGSTVEVTIFADSLGKSEVPLRFGGSNATTNNLHAQFYTQLNKWLKINPEPTRKAYDALQYWEKVGAERDRRIEFFRSFMALKEPQPLLEQWVVSSLENSAKAKLYDFLKQQGEPIPTALWGIRGLNAPLSPKAADRILSQRGFNTASTVGLDSTSLFTFSKADCFQQFVHHALATTPNLAEASLPISTLSSLILKYVPQLTTQDSLKLREFIQGGTAKMKDVTFLNTLFNKRRDTLEVINTYELYVRKYGEQYSISELEYLKSIFYVGNLYTAPTPKMVLWYEHIRPRLTNSYYIRSLDEIHHLESADTTAIREVRTLIGLQESGNYLEDIGWGLRVLYKNYMDGDEIWEEIKRQSKGKPTYLIFWTNDEYGRRALADARQLQASLPKEQLNFVFLCEYETKEDVWLENVVKSKSRGLHVKLTHNQNIFFENEWAITQVPFGVLVDANGKYIKRDAPLPADREGWDKIWNKVFRQ